MNSLPARKLRVGLQSALADVESLVLMFRIHPDADCQFDSKPDEQTGDEYPRENRDQADDRRGEWRRCQRLRSDRYEAGQEMNVT